MSAAGGFRAMRVEIEAAIIGVGGALLVWLASWLWSLHVDRRTGKRVRAMLSMEIDENLQNLREWWERTNASAFPSNHPMAGVQHADAVKRLELPIWSHRVWQATVQLVPIALDETKYREVHRHHQNLDQLSALKELDSQKLSVLEGRVRTAVEEILKAGNPLGKRAHN
jgi:hypothetical protein